jgi:hypothetical protein
MFHRERRSPSVLLNHSDAISGSKGVSQRQSPRGQHRVAPALNALETSINALEQLMTSQGLELRIQFERISQLQAECDSLRIRFSETQWRCAYLAALHLRTTTVALTACSMSRTESREWV